MHFIHANQYIWRVRDSSITLSTTQEGILSNFIKKFAPFPSNSQAGMKERGHSALSLIKSRQRSPCKPAGRQ